MGAQVSMDGKAAGGMAPAGAAVAAEQRVSLLDPRSPAYGRTPVSQWKQQRMVAAMGGGAAAALGAEGKMVDPRSPMPGRTPLPSVASDSALVKHGVVTAIPLHLDAMEAFAEERAAGEAAAMMDADGTEEPAVAAAATIIDDAAVVDAAAGAENVPAISSSCALCTSSTVSENLAPDCASASASAPTVLSLAPSGSFAVPTTRKSRSSASLGTTSGLGLSLSSASLSSSHAAAPATPTILAAQENDSGMSEILDEDLACSPNPTSSAGFSSALNPSAAATMGKILTVVDGGEGQGETMALSVAGIKRAASDTARRGALQQLTNTKKKTALAGSPKTLGTLAAAGASSGVSSLGSTSSSSGAQNSSLAAPAAVPSPASSGTVYVLTSSPAQRSLRV